MIAASRGDETRCREILRIGRQARSAKAHSDDVTDIVIRTRHIAREDAAKLIERLAAEKPDAGK
jgi:hypothetical protein